MVLAFIILLSSVLVLNAKYESSNQKQKEQTYKILNEKQTPTYIPTATLTPNEKTATTIKTQPVVNSDPIIDCLSSHPNCNGETIRLRQSLCSKIYCCGFGDGRWELYPSEDKCKQAWAAQYPSNTNEPSYVYPTYTPTVYYGCTLCYPALGTCSTYNYSYKTKAECDSAQAALNQRSTSTEYTIPTPVPTPQITKNQCIASVNDKWRSQMIVYGCAYPCPDTGDCGPSSVCDALWSLAQKDMNVCNQYP